MAIEGEILSPSDGPLPMERAYGRELGMSEAEIDEEFAKLVLHRRDKPRYPAWRWFRRYIEYRKSHPAPKRTVIDVANEINADLDDQIARHRTPVDAGRDLVARLKEMDEATLPPSRRVAEAREVTVARQLGCDPFDLSGGKEFVARATRSHYVTVVRGTDEWRKRVRAGHPETLCKPVHGADGRLAEGWEFRIERGR